MPQTSSRRFIGLAILILVLGLVAVSAYIWFSGGSGAPSAPITAPTLAIRPTSAVTSTVETTAEATRQVVSSTAVPTAEVTTQASVTAEATSSPRPASSTEAATENATAPAPSAILFQIVPDSSQVSFTTHEELRGAPNTVVGTTNQVAGQIYVDFNTPSNSQVGVIRVDVRTLATDNEFRNRAIRTAILQSSQDQFEYAQFTPTALLGMPDKVTIGQAVSFQIVGDLTLRDITKSVTFDTTVTVVSDSRLEGTATATVTRAQYQLEIPSVPGVANVSDNVELQIDFVATAASS
jgi:polyisoprenoid-binding protein YceI